MTFERLYRCATPAAMARRAANGAFNSYTVSGLAFREDPDEVVVEVDTNGAINPATGKQIALIAVQPHHPSSQEVAERIWNQLAWGDIEGDDWVDPSEVDVKARGWDVRVKFFYEVSH